jgi:hypothetical protein
MIENKPISRSSVLIKLNMDEDVILTSKLMKSIIADVISVKNSQKNSKKKNLFVNYIID